MPPVSRHIGRGEFAGLHDEVDDTLEQGIEMYSFPDSYRNLM